MSIEGREAMRKLFVYARDLRFQSQAQQARDALRMRHPKAYFLGRLWRCPDCGKTARTVENLTNKLCKRGNSRT